MDATPAMDATPCILSLLKQEMLLLWTLFLQSLSLKCKIISNTCHFIKNNVNFLKAETVQIQPLAPKHNSYYRNII